MSSATLPMRTDIGSRLAATGIANGGPLTLDAFEAALRAGLECAHRAARDDSERIAAAILAHDPGEFVGDDGSVLGAYLRHHEALRRPPTCDALPMSRAELELENERTRAMVDGPRPASTVAARPAPAPTTAVAPAAPTLDDLAQRLKLGHTPDTFGGLLDAAGLRGILTDGTLSFQRWRLREITGSEAAARALDADLLAAHNVAVAADEAAARVRAEQRRAIRAALGS